MAVIVAADIVAGNTIANSLATGFNARRTGYLNNSFLIDKVNIKNHILPSFTKKIFKSIVNY